MHKFPVRKLKSKVTKQDIRIQSIIEVLKDAGAATTRELSGKCEVTEMTIRRDLLRLSEMYPDLAVVVTNVGECASVVSNKVSGIVVAPSNELELATGILSLLKNEKLRLMAAENLKNEVNSKYSQNIYITQLVSIYKFE